jgi:tetratricopeptide (TPR) repeat protein
MTPTPPAPPAGTDVPPARRRPLAALRRLAAPLRLVRRHPGRALAVVFLLGLIACGLTLAGTQFWAAYHLRAARAALARYHTAEAGEHLRACMRVWPNDPEVLFLAARAARRSGLFDDADGLLARCQELRGRDDGLVLERALLSAERGDVDDVLKFCRAKVEADDPASLLILEAVARGCLRSYHLSDAEWATETWLRRAPDDPMAHLLRGRVARERLGLTDAATDFRRALEIDPELDEARDQLTIVLLDTHQGPEALPHLEYLRQRRPDDPGLAVRLAQCRDLLGQQDEAARLLDAVLAKYPDFLPALEARAKLAQNAGQWGEAEVLLRKALTQAPGEANVLRQLDTCLRRTGKTEDAKALEPRLQQAKQDLERIQQLVNHDIQADPRNPDLHYEAGMIFLRAGAPADGLRWLQSAIRLDPRHVKAHEALADFYGRVGDAAKAERHRRLAHEAAAAKGSPP